MNEVLERTELITPEAAVALAGLLDVPLPDLESDGLPLGWHWLHLLERPLQQDLGPDGHPVRNALPVPPGPGRRRMWAGGSICSTGPLRVGAPATRRSEVLDTTEKQGRSGPLTFVTVGHTIVQRGEVVVEERQEILYRQLLGGEPPAAEAQALKPLPVAPDEWSIPVDPALLFRFSALTYNAHRIHYDRDWARDEGYPGLVVHGPLQALVMAEAARAGGFDARSGVVFDYRLVAPLFEDQGLVVRALVGDDEVRTTVRDHRGRRTAEGVVRHS